MQFLSYYNYPNRKVCNRSIYYNLCIGNIRFPSNEISKFLPNLISEFIDTSQSGSFYADSLCLGLLSRE